MSATGDWWAEQVTAWGRSGLTGRDYALAVGVNEGTLRHWKSRLGRSAAEPKPGGGGVAGFVEVVLGEDRAGAERDTATLELVLPRGLLVRVPAGFDAIALQRLLQALEGR